MAKNYIINLVMSELVVHGIRDKKYYRIFDLTRHDYEEIINSIDTLEEILSYTPVSVTHDFQSNGTLNGYIQLKIEWNDYK